MMCCSDDLCSLREEDEQSDVQQADSWQGDEGFEEEEEEDSDEEYDDSGFLAEPAAASVVGAPQSGWSILDREKLKTMQVLSSHAVATSNKGDCCRLAGKACQLPCLWAAVAATHVHVRRPRHWSRSSASWAAAAPQHGCF